MRKREKFIISSIVLAAGLIGTQLAPLELRPLAIFFFFIASIGISAWALLKDLNGVEWITIVPFPSMYALSVALFYFLLPSSLLSRFAIIILFGIGMYALYLTSNIYAIGKVKTIQLLRAAHAIGSLFLLLMTLFFYNFILSLQLHPLANVLLVGLVTFPLLLSSMWSLTLERKLGSQLLWVAGLFSVVLAEIAGAISLLPSALWPSSLFLTSCVYIGYGMIAQYSAGRLFKRTVREYVLLGAFVTISFVLLLQWK